MQHVRLIKCCWRALTMTAMRLSAEEKGKRCRMVSVSRLPLPPPFLPLLMLPPACTQPVQERQSHFCLAGISVPGCAVHGSMRDGKQQAAVQRFRRAGCSKM
jgi:hypothetical protein